MSYLDKRNNIDLIKQKIDEYGDLNVEIKKKINYKFRLDWNYYSNNMEGNSLTMQETRSIMVNNLTVGGKPLKDVLEMKGHDEIISEILQIGKAKIRLSEARIRKIHKGIMHEDAEIEKKKIGVWKLAPNYLYNYKGERFDFVAPDEVAEKMHILLNKTNAAIDSVQRNKKNAPHPLDIALQFHLDYVMIHPFYDGNGRTARILTNLLLISFGYPPFWVKTDEKNTYSQYIADIQAYSGKPDLFFEFAADLILRSQQLILAAIEGKDILSEDDFDKEIEMLQRRQNIAKEPIKKSKQVVQQTLKTVYFPLIQQLDLPLNKLNTLFEKHSWMYFEAQKIPKHTSLNELIQSFYAISETGEDSYHAFKASYYLMNYKDKNNFNVEISLEIHFSDTDYSIHFFIGQPLFGGMIGQSFTKFIRALSKEETPFHAFKNEVLFQLKYDEIIEKEQIIAYTKDISRKVLSYIKQKIA